jgi:CubicO group peptidase (beta-lactamase class C family)
LGVRAGSIFTDHPPPLIPRTLFLIIAMTLGGIAAEPRDLSPVLEGICAKYKLPACAAAVMEHGQVTALGASGLRRSDREVRVTTADVWHLGSCTKSMSAVLVGAMVDAGKLRWDLPIPVALPGIPCDPAWQKLTVWDLVTHRCGIGHVPLPDQIRTLAERPPLEQRTALARWLLSAAPAKPPGKSVYSNAGYGLLGAILERASGEDYETMLQRYLFTPLELKTAGFGPAATPGQLDQPWGHRRRGDLLVPVEPLPSTQFTAAVAPAACVHLSLLEFARYASWFSTNEPRLLSPETFARLHTPPPGENYAGGVWTSELPARGGEAVCHTGQMGGSFAMFYAGRDLACVCVFNMEGTGWEWLGDVIAEAILRREISSQGKE